MEIRQACASYFKGIEELSNYKNNDRSQNLIAIAKIVSYFTVIIPLAVAIVYACASLCGRVTHTTAPIQPITPPATLSDQPPTQKKTKATKQTVSESAPDTSWFSHSHLYNYILTLADKYPALLLCRPCTYGISNNAANVDLAKVRKEARTMNYLKEVRNEVLIDIHADQQCTTHKDLNYTEDCRSKTILAYPLLIRPEPSVLDPNPEPNHWTLLIVDRAGKRVEYYDSKQNYGESEKIEKYLKNITALLNQYDRKKGEQEYTFHRMINKVLQPDGYQCGPWVLYFIEKRLENPGFKFEQLDPNKCQGEIEAFRQKVLQTIANL